MKLGLALSGGGMRCVAHIGVLKAFAENKISIDLISGTSGGSVIAALYAIGYNAQQIEEIFLAYQKAPIKRNLINSIRNFFNSSKNSVIDFDFNGLLKQLFNGLFHKNLTTYGFIKGDIIEKIMFSYCQKAHSMLMKDSKIPLAIPAVDIYTAESVVFVSSKKTFLKSEYGLLYDDVLISDAVRASTAFPVIFMPKNIRGRILVDGGLKDNIPANILRKMGADKVIAVNLGSSTTAHKLGGLYEVAARAVEIMSQELSQYILKDADLSIDPQIFDIGLLEADKIDECIERGYMATLAVIPVITKLLKK